jgi:nicotinic acid mononucleotide adenylyltransferase
VGVFPGTFDPLTVAHVVVAECAVGHLGLHRLDLAISLSALGKEHLDDASVEERVAAIEAVAARRSWMRVVVTRDRLVADVARGYDAVVMGADKWAQVNDPAWYGGDVAARDAAVAQLPRVAVAPRAGFAAPAALLLPVPGHLAEVSSTAVRSGRHGWRAEPGPGSRSTPDQRSR